MKNLLYIFIGGGLGSVLRFLISSYTQKLWTYNNFPIGTFLVNISGCLAIGVFSSYFLKNDNSDLRWLLVTGFCGGYTTFSTFSAESLSLLQNGQVLMMIIYSLLSLILGVFAVFLGFQFMKMNFL